MRKLLGDENCIYYSPENPVRQLLLSGALSEQGDRSRVPPALPAKERGQGTCPRVPSKATPWGLALTWRRQAVSLFWGAATPGCDCQYKSDPHDSVKLIHP